MEVADIIAAVDLLEYAEDECGLELEFKNGEYWGLSPFKPENTPSFSINQELQTFYDFSSGQGGNIISFIRGMKECTVKEAVDILLNYAGISNDDNYRSMPITAKIAKRYKPKEIVKKKEITAPQILPDSYMEIYEEDESKLREWTKEGMSLEILKEYEVKYDPFSDRLVYPIRNYKGQIVNVCGRTLDKNFKEKKLRKYTYFKKWGGEMNVLFGASENAEEIKKQKEVIIFEGAKSVFIAATWGYRNCCALLTSHLSDGQFNYLIRLGARVVFALDEDIDITKDKNIQRLKRYVPVEYVRNFPKILEPKMAPVDKGKKIWDKLYAGRRKLR